MTATATPSTQHHADGPVAGPGALDGVRVLDLTHQVAGPSATLALAFMGADVVKVVAPGDRSSFTNLPFYFNSVSKRSVALDLKSEEGRETLLRLAAEADVMIENFGPGVIERLNLTYDAVREVNPEIIYAQIKGFAPGTAQERFPCFDPIVQAYAGASSVTGEPDGLPQKPGPDVGDTGTGMVMAIGLLAALYQRQQTGKGQHLQLAMSDQVATFMRLHFAWPMSKGIDTPRFGNAAPFLEPVAPSGLFHCDPFGPNDYVHIHVGNDKQWHGLVSAMGREDLLDDPRFASQATRGQHKAEVDEIVGDWAAKRSKIDAMMVLGAAGVPAGAVRTTTEVLEDEDLRERGIFVPVPHPDLGEAVIPAWPIKMSGTPIRVEAPREPGSDLDEVLTDWLGTSRTAAGEPTARSEGAQGALHG